jgi:uncharacterized membrane protein YecN with MAPEG domain
MENYFWFSVLVAVNGLMLIGLTINVSRLRIKNKISLGDGDNKDLLRAIRTHANGVEQVPTYAIVILALTLMQASSELLAVLVAGFTLSRICHAWGMLFRNHTGRRVGMGLTYVFQLVGVIALFVQLLG